MAKTSSGNFERTAGNKAATLGHSFALLAIGYWLLVAPPALAFEGPTQPAGQGTGSFSYSRGRFGVGTSSIPFKDTRFLIMTSSTNPNDFALKVINNSCGAGTNAHQNCGPIFTIRNDGSVVMGGGQSGSGYYQPHGETYYAGLTVWGPTHIHGKMFVNGSFNTNFFDATVNASHVVGGSVFGSSTGKGNYEFQHTTSTVNVMYIDATNDRVGIGTTGPAQKLQVGSNWSGTFNSGTTVLVNSSGGTQDVAPTVNISNAASTNTTAYVKAIGLNIHNDDITTTGTRVPALTFSRRAGGVYTDVLGAIDAVDEAAGPDGNWRGGGLAFHTANTGSYGITEKMRIDRNGNVGIGTTGPGTKLHIGGVPDNKVITFDQSGRQSAIGTYFSSGATDSRIDFFVSDGNVSGSSNNRMSIMGDGRVGIGTASPPDRLSVQGNMQIQGGDTNTGYDRYFKMYGNSNPVANPNRWAGLAVYNNGGNNVNQLHFFTGTGDGARSATMVIKEDGNVGIGTANPTTAGLVASKAVSGVTIDATTGRIINVGSPALASDAATKSYVDTALTSTPVVVASTTGAYVLRSGDTMTGNLNMAGKNINAVNKAYITTIDPLYQIGGANYATYVPSFAGGVKEEYTGRGVFRNNQSLLINDYTFAIDFANMEKGSDLWVWRHAVEFGPETVEAVATPYGGFAQIYYTIAGNTLTFHGNAPVAFSFRLTGKRFDWREWPTKADDSLPANLIVK